jgi:hypothetical protein
MPTRRAVLCLFCGVLALTAAFAQQATPLKETHPMHHAHGTFTVKMGAPTAGPAEGLSRFTMTKEIHGGIEGTSQGEMISGGDYKLGAAGYVAIEFVSGTLEGKSGSFALQHTATMKGPALNMDILVTPGSGTGELKGIDGKFTITIKDGQHFYDLDYTLPEN